MAISSEEMLALKSEIVSTLKQMQPEMQAGIEKQVVETVNGKILAVQRTQNERIKIEDERWQTMELFMQHMAPLGDTVSFLQIFRKFAVWTSGFLAAVGIMWVAVLGVIRFLK